MPPISLARQIIADPELPRMDRIALAMCLQADGFTLNDITRITSIRRQAVIGLRAQTGLQTRPDRKSARAVTRELDPIVAALCEVPRRSIPELAREFGLNETSVYGILRSVEYTQLCLRAPTLTRKLRCPGCEQITIEHPCTHCGTDWLQDLAAA